MKALEKYAGFLFSQCECILDFVTGTGSSSTLLVCRYVGLFFGFLEKQESISFLFCFFLKGFGIREKNI